MKKKITTTINIVLMEWVEVYILDMSKKGISMKKNDVIEKALLLLREKELKNG